MDKNNITLITAIVAACCGLLGAVLGIINTWQQMRRDKLRLRVKTSHIIVSPDLGNFDFSIEVINLSDFAVTINDVGFLLRESGRLTLIAVSSIDQPQRLPVRLEPRTTYTKCFCKSAIGPRGADIKSAYVTTACGETVTGDSKALGHLAKEFQRG